MTLSGKARVAGVMGWPVGHSLSPRLHGYWLSEYGIDGAYVPFPVMVDRLGDALRALPALGIAGVNLTVPHKVAACGIVDAIDPVARRIGAINTVVVGPDGALEGRNTDAYGFITAIADSVPGWTAKAAPCVVIGAGGAARAVCVALQEAGAADIRLVNRTEARARDLAAELGAGVTVAGWDGRDAALDDAGLLVNATSLGMRGQPPLDLDLARLPLGAVVNDIVYVPLETPLLAAAARRGNPVVDGLGMLLHQGRPGFAAWFGRDPSVTPAVRAHVLAGLTP
ncbi:MAG: shikimate dehydrogenase [Alphaproteobacteria bacterium]